MRGVTVRFIKAGDMLNELVECDGFGGGGAFSKLAIAEDPPPDVHRFTVLPATAYSGPSRPGIPKLLGHPKR